MPTSRLLKRLLSGAASAAPDAPQTIRGSLAPRERVDIGALRAVNDGGDLVVKQLNHDGTLNWACSPDSELCISNLANRPDEGVIFTRFGAGSWAFMAQVRPERCVVFRPVPFDILPLVRTGQGEYARDWPGPAANDNGRKKKFNAEHAESAESTLEKNSSACSACSALKSPALDAGERAAGLQDVLAAAYRAGLRPAPDDQAAGLRAAVAVAGSREPVAGKPNGHLGDEGPAECLECDIEFGSPECNRCPALSAFDAACDERAAKGRRKPATGYRLPATNTSAESPA